jgi:hypothetical protein
MARRRNLGPLCAEFCEGDRYWRPNVFAAIGRLNFGFGDVTGLRAGYGGGRWRAYVSRSIHRWAVAIAWESK